MLPFEELKGMWTSTTLPWEVIALIGVGISVALSAIAYMLSSAFGSKDLKKWARAEFVYALTSIFLVAMLLIFVDVIATKMTLFGSEIARIATPGMYDSIKNSNDPTILAKLYVDQTAMVTRVAFMRVTCVGMIPSAINSIEVGDLVPSGSAVLLPNLIINSSRAAANALYFVILTLYLQKHLLVFIGETMLTMFLPIGIVMRTFPIVRSTGNLFIAIAIGAAVVYPLTYGMILVLSQPAEGMFTWGGITKDTKIDFSAEGQRISCTTAAEGSGLVSIAAIPQILLSKFGIGKLGMYLTAFGGSALLISKFIGEIMDMLPTLLLYAGIYPFVVTAITLTFIRSLTQFLGVEAQEIAKGLVKLL